MLPLHTTFSRYVKEKGNYLAVQRYKYLKQCWNKVPNDVVGLNLNSGLCAGPVHAEGNAVFFLTLQIRMFFSSAKGFSLL